VKPVSIIAYWCALIVLGLNFSGSLFAYNAGFSVSIVAGLVCFAFITGAFLNLETFLLLFSLPLLKLSGIVAVLYVALFIALLVCGASILNVSYLSSAIARQFSVVFKSSWKLFAVVIAGLY